MLGKNILKFRKQKGLSQEELAEKIDVTRQTISNWELGETTPNPDQLKKLSKEFNISIDELLDNEIKNVIVEKVSNTEKLSGTILYLMKFFLLMFVIGIGIVLFYVIMNVVVHKDTGREIEESIICEIYGEEHGYTITYEELIGRPIGEGGDSYFYDILGLEKYNDAHQIFNIINDYVKKNGGKCHMIENHELNNLVNMYIKEDSLTATGAVIVIEEEEDYEITYGEPFWIEKYDYSTNTYKKLDIICDNCAFNLPAYQVTPEKPLELKQDWSHLYGKLDTGIYRIVKEASYRTGEYLIWTEFEIE